MSVFDDLKEAREANLAAEEFAKAMERSMRRYESLVAELDADIARQEKYLQPRNIPADTDLVIESLRKRRTNLVSSLETLRAHAPEAERAFARSTERLVQILTLAQRELKPMPVERAGTEQ